MMHWIDPDCMPETQGAVEGFIINWHGEIDGALLTGARQTSLLVCTPPHMGAEIEAAIKIGEMIRVRSIRPRRTEIVAAVAVIASNGDTILDNGPDHEDKRKVPHGDSKLERMDVEGVVRMSLFGPKNEPRGALLEDDTVVRIGSKGAASLAKLLCPGSPVAVRGTGLQTKHGRVIAAEKVGPDRRSLKRVKAPKHKDEPKHKMHRATNQPVPAYRARSRPR
jgi:hypothetical protein